ncbi:MAG: DUF927 domain-containing protein [candidate division WS1 bacterium]|nr:DUF927 domain-containing protein [candidate division WS1 bacterium]
MSRSFFSDTPASLRKRDQWVLWRARERNGRPTKVPCGLAGHPINAADPANWLTFEQAAIGAGTIDASGLGIVLADGLYGVDLDGVRDPKDGSLTRDAERIVRDLNSYAEVSPSGAGVHILVYADRLPGPERRRGAVEMYGAPESPRYFTFTGQRLPDAPEEVCHRQAELEAVHARYVSSTVIPPFSPADNEPDVPLDLRGVQSPRDIEVLEAAAASNYGHEFLALWSGDMSAYGGDHSRADLALCRHLILWAGGDTVQADRLFRASALMRPKWDEGRGANTYGWRTLHEAVVRLHGRKPRRRRRSKPKPPEPQGRPAPAEEEPAEEPCPYREEDGRLMWRRVRNGAASETVLASFTARILQDQIVDDGQETARRFVIQVRPPTGKPLSLPVHAADFIGGRWLQSLPASCVVGPGYGARDTLRHAVQSLSEPRESHIYAHTGWAVTQEGRHAYLSASGGISAAGHRPDLRCEAPGLDRVRLPVPRGEEGLTEAYRAALRLLDISPRMWPLLCLPFLAVSGGSDFVVWLHGPTGSYKSTTAALLQSFFGPCERTSLPANFTSTAVALEALLFTAKDCLLVVDDFAPPGSRKDAERLNGLASALVRGVGDSHGRARGRPDSSLRLGRPSRCLALVTSELAPPGGESAAARTLVLPWRGKVNLAALTASQAETEKLAECMAFFVRHEAKARDTGVEPLALRRDLFAGGHPRTGEACARLLRAGQTFLARAVEAGALWEDQRADLEDDLVSSLQRLIRMTDGEVLWRRPERLFLDLLGSAVRSGAARIEGLEASTRAAPSARTVGFTREELLFVDPSPALQAVRAQAEGEGVAFGYTRESVAHALASSGLLARAFTPDRLATRCRDLNGGLAALWVLPCDALSDAPADVTPLPLAR